MPLRKAEVFSSLMIISHDNIIRAALYERLRTKQKSHVLIKSTSSSQFSINIINKNIHGCLEISNFSSCVLLNISLVFRTHLWTLKEKFNIPRRQCINLLDTSGSAGLFLLIVTEHQGKFNTYSYWVYSSNEWCKCQGMHNRYIDSKPASYSKQSES